MQKEKYKAIILSAAASGAASEAFDTKSTRRLLKKMDLAPIPFLALLYL
jgi:hypothetical protein